MKLACFLPGEISLPPPAADFPPLNAALLTSHGCDEHWQALASDGTAMARASLWWSHVPALEGERLGVLGHFAAVNAEAAQLVLQRAIERLQEMGCTRAVGPMDGHTWRKYRLVTESGSEPAFFLEPTNPPDWPEYFLTAGFGPYARYMSLLAADLSIRDPRADRARQRLERAGMIIRALNPARFEADLRLIYEVSVASFQHNFLYTEIAEAEFLAQYLPYRDQLRPDLVLLALQGDRPVGFVFGLPDFAQAQRGVPINTVIGKTLAIIPGKTYGGLGVVLTDLLHQRSAELGYRRLIHALQHEQNQVRNMSAHFGAVMRRYTLFARPLVA